MLDFIELSKLVEDLETDQINRNNSLKLRDLTKNVTVNLERPQIYSAAQEDMCLSLRNKNNKVRSTSQIPVLRGHVDVECCCCFYKEKEFEQKQGM